jgi:hypothetical protein
MINEYIVDSVLSVETSTHRTDDGITQWLNIELTNNKGQKDTIRIYGDSGIDIKKLLKQAL